MINVKILVFKDLKINSYLSFCKVEWKIFNTRFCILDEVLQHIFVSNGYFSRWLVLVYIKVRVIQFVFYVIYMSCICKLDFASFCFKLDSVYLTFTYAF